MIYWGDESGLNTAENYERGYAPKGHPPVLPVETTKERINMLCAVSEGGSLRFMLYEERMNQQRLIRFLRQLSARSRQKIFLILDNLKVHHGKKVSAWLDRHKEQIEVFFLPPYAPESNPDEYLNHAVKLHVHSGDLPCSKEELRHKTFAFLRSLQKLPDKVSSFFLHPSLSYIKFQK